MHFGCVELVEQHGSTRSSLRALQVERVESRSAKWNLVIAISQQEFVLSRIFAVVNSAHIHYVNQSRHWSPKVANLQMNALLKSAFANVIIIRIMLRDYIVEERQYKKTANPKGYHTLHMYRKHFIQERNIGIRTVPVL